MFFVFRVYLAILVKVKHIRKRNLIVFGIIKILIEIFLEVEKIKKERDGLDFRGAFPGAVRRAPLACYWLFYMCPS